MEKLKILLHIILILVLIYIAALFSTFVKDFAEKQEQMSTEIEIISTNVTNIEETLKEWEIIE